MSDTQVKLQLISPTAYLGEPVVQSELTRDARRRDPPSALGASGLGLSPQLFGALALDAARQPFRPEMGAQRSRRRRGRRARPIFAAISLCLGASACFSVAELPSDPPSLVATRPESPIGLKQAIELEFSEAMQAPAPIVQTAAGQGLAVEVRAGGSEALWRVAPAGAWPAQTELVLRLEEGAALSRDGRALPEASVLLQTEAAPEEAEAWLRWPAPGTRAPVNTRWIWFQVQGGARPAALSSEAGARVEPAAEEALGALFLWSLPEGALEPGAGYRLEAEPGAVPEGALGALRTSTVVDREAPRLGAVRWRFLGGALSLSATCDEPARLHAALSAAGGERWAEASPSAGTALSLSVEGLPAGEVLSLSLWAEDLAGNESAREQTELRVPAPLGVRIQEVVTTPMRDWNDSDGEGQPFDPLPGAGAVTSTDEWIELVNTSPAAVDLEQTPILVEAVDGSPSVTELSQAPNLYFGAGGGLERWLPGEALVVRLRGELSQRELTLSVKSGEQLLDRWYLGEGPGAEHPGGRGPDPSHESLARAADGMIRWCVPTPGEAAPNPSCL